jgi:hypothetical protein
MFAIPLIFMFGCNAKTSGQQNGSKQQLPKAAFHLKKTTPKSNYFPDDKENVSLSLELAQKLSPYPLLKPNYSPFKIKHSYVTVNDDPTGNRDQKVLITYIGDNHDQFMQIEMQNKENIYSQSMKNEYEKVDLFQGIKGYVQKSDNTVSLFWQTDGYTIFITLPNKNIHYTKSDIIKIARSLKSLNKQG